jgi:hypothetical protein
VNRTFCPPVPASGRCLRCDSSAHLVLPPATSFEHKSLQLQQAYGNNLGVFIKSSSAFEFVQTTSPCLPEDEEHPLKQHLLKSTVTMLQSYAEEYLRCIVSAGTFWEGPGRAESLGFVITGS